MISVPIQYVRVLRALSSGKWTAGESYVCTVDGSPLPRQNKNLSNFSVIREMREIGLLEQREQNYYIEHRLTELGHEALKATL